MSQVLNLKRGDTAPLFRARILDGTTPVSLTTAASVKLLMKAGTTPFISAALTVEDQTANPGWVRRSWQPTDLATAGQYRAEIEVTWNDGTVQTFPASGAITVLIHDDLG